MKKLYSIRRVPALLKKKKLIVFDMDGTLTPSKAPMDPAMSRLLVRLLAVKKVAVIGGGKYGLFKKQLLAPFKKCPAALLKNMFLFPTTSTTFYRYDGGWKNVYTLTLSVRERAKIIKAFRDVLKETKYVLPEKTYGKTIEDRGTQVSFSPLGQDIVAYCGEKEGVRRKEEWKKKYEPMRVKVADILAKRLTEFEVHRGGLTTIDVTRKGIDKAYGIRAIERQLKVPVRDMVFVGDALYSGGNDSAARRTGVDCIAVRNPEETKEIIKKILEH